MNKENIECCDLNIIVSDFYNHLKNYLLGKIHNNELAEDIVQEVMLKVVTAHQKNLQVKNIKAWLFQIARNTLIDYYRKKQNHKQEYQENIDEVLIELQDKSFRPDDYLIPMINLLPQKYSNPLLLSDIENIPQAEIAKQLNLSVSATKMRIQRARKMLYNKFIECCDIEYTKNGAFLHCDN
ncbi:MAG: sigma-70 family RNA polymerase sigma factor [Bacteroidales bacterium]|nr:sigma-70 family RNA polymerase sigma factor [Bacteroidales bacterium]